MTHIISKHSKIQAKKLNLIIKVSNKKGKKIDVYDADNNYINSIGAIGYNDYGSYLNIYNLEYANQRKKLYILRHKKNSDAKYLKQWLFLHISKYIF